MMAWINEHRKLIVALVGAVITVLTIALDSPEWLSMIIPVLTAAGVYQVPNVEASVKEG